jgi:aryl-phospho-beta-D-glucosidase BglC (GH1 family)
MNNHTNSRQKLNLEIEVNQETGDLILYYLDHNGYIIINERDRDGLLDQLTFLRWDEEQQIKERMLKTDILEEIKASKHALVELKQEQTYWEAKWKLTTRKDMIDYINYHTADLVRDTAIKSDLEIDDLLMI